jgi:hypothetical protein
MTYFISGHRDLTQEEFNEHYAPCIYQTILEDSFAEFCVGDWEGCDSMFITYIEDNFVDVTIHLYFVNKPRLYLNDNSKNNLVLHKLNNYDECDASMTQDSDFDIAWVRPGREDSYTAMNIKRRYYGKV